MSPPQSASLAPPKKDPVHEHRTAKIIELVSSSTKSFEDAIRNGVADAQATTRGITGADVRNMSVRCDNGKIVAYQVNLNIAFGVERTTKP
jgi:hypothetical protein